MLETAVESPFNHKKVTEISVSGYCEKSSPLLYNLLFSAGN